MKPYELALRLRRQVIKLWNEIGLWQLFRHYRTALYVVAGAAILVLANSWSLKGINAEDIGRGNLIFPLITDEFANAESGGNGPTEAPATTPYITSEGGVLKPLLINSETGVAGRDRIEYYTVQAGDTLSGIADHFNLNLTTVLWENQLTARSAIRIGQRLTILPTDGVTYKVRRGDTASKIGQRFGVSADDILSFNQGPQGLAIGQTIIIPGGRPLAAPPPPKPAPAQIAQAPAPIYAPPAPSGSRLQWPTPHHRITQYFTWYHTGIDVAENIGTPVYAAEAGVIEEAGWNRGGYGYYIIIDHGGGLETLYAHNSRLLVKTGDYVERGQQISASGSTGHSTGPHVHFEVRVNGRRVNPLNYVR